MKILDYNEILKITVRDNDDGIVSFEKGLTLVTVFFWRF